MNFDLSANLPPEPPVLPSWRLRPSRALSPDLLADEEFFDLIDSYFTGCAAEGRRPLLTELALALGCDSLPQLVNDARRYPLRMRAISRAFLAIGVGYEELLCEGKAVAQFMLTKIPSYDSKEHPSQAPTYFLRERQEIGLDIAGVEKLSDIGRSLGPRESYLQLVRNRVLEEVDIAANIDDAEYVEIPVE
jgi:hypothetical protein